jgi:nucleolar protein 58
VAAEKKLQETDADDIYENFFADESTALKSLQLVSFQPFADTAEAVTAATAMLESSSSSGASSSRVPPQLAKFLQKKLKKASKSSLDGLAVADKALAVSLKENSDITEKYAKLIHDDKTQELFRGIRQYLERYLETSESAGISPADLRAMQLGLSHSLSRYKLKFSADKVDTMVIQAVGLVDELDKEINTYSMRVKEWYGWHFPELQSLVSDNASYAKLVLKCGLRSSISTSADLSAILEDESLEAAVKEAAEISMGTEIADVDVLHISALAEQVLSLTDYRAQLMEYLKNRMNAIAPNLTILVGELVGARLIAHAGSLLNLAKQPASTVQILGAEKALFRALKTKHDTPKYGLIYHASLIGQAAPKNKGKISRVLAAKASLAIRVDALSDDVGTGEDGDVGMMDTTVGFEGRAKVEARLRQLEGGTFASTLASSGGALTAQKTAKYNPVAAKMASTASTYNPASDVVALDTTRKEGDDDDSSSAEKKKKAKKDKKRRKSEAASAEKNGGDADDDSEEGQKQKKKRRKSEGDASAGAESNGGHDDEKAAKKAKKAAKKAKKEKKKSKD